MKTINTLSMIVIVAFIVIYLIVKSTIIYIPMGNVGVRIQEIGILGARGLIEKDYGPGWHRNFWLIDKWGQFDSTVQTLEMTQFPFYGDLQRKDDIQVQSSDGYSISLDVTVKYRIKEGMAHKLFQQSRNNYREIVKNEARNACMKVFGTMKTENFYNSKERKEKSFEAKNMLAKNLEDNYIDVIDLLIRNVQFDPEYENKIRKKKLADQEVELNKSMKKAEEMRGKTQMTEAETSKLLNVIIKEKEAELVKMEAATNREIAKIKADYEKYYTEKCADADLIESRMKAEGNLLIKQAEAEGEKLRNQAMQGVGGSTIVALEAAKNLNLGNMMVSTQETDFLNLDKMADKLGAQNKK